MNKEQQPLTEAEAMKAAAESWDTPVGKNETALKTVVPNAETMEDNQIEMEIQNESAELEKNSEAAEKALADVGGLEGLQSMLQEMPEDKKTAMIKKLQEDHERTMSLKNYDYEEASTKSKFALSLLNPAKFYDYIRDKNLNSFEAKAEAAGLTTVGNLFGVIPVGGLLEAGYFGVKSLKEKIGMNMEERRHKKELKKLENSEA